MIYCIIYGDSLWSSISASSSANLGGYGDGSVFNQTADNFCKG